MQPTQKPIATTTKKLFSRTTTVNATIQAPPAALWSLLTDVERYPTWNSTLISIEGVDPAGRFYQAHLEVGSQTDLYAHDQRLPGASQARLGRCNGEPCLHP